MKYNKIDKQLFIENRQRFMAQMKPNCIAIFHANDQMMRNGDCYFPFRQNSDLFYLTGLDQEDVILVLYPNCPKGKAFEQIIFTKQTNEHIAVWDGYKYTKEDASETSGIETIHWLSAMKNVLNEMILLSDGIYVNSNENDRADVAYPTKDQRHTKILSDEYPGHPLHRSQPIMKKLR